MRGDLTMSDDRAGNSGRPGDDHSDDQDANASWRRELSGRLLREAIESNDRLDAAALQLKRLDSLSEFEGRLQASLDTDKTRETVSHAVLPELDAWAVVDVVDEGAPLRLCIVHVDAAKRSLVDALNDDWRPAEDDAIGFAAARRVGHTFTFTPHTDDDLLRIAHSERNAEILRAIGVGACLVVPMRRNGAVDGAITFVSASARDAYTGEEVAYAERLAAACERALANAGAMAAATEMMRKAEQATRSQTNMLGHVSHELRTPLSAIGGFAELMQMGVRGPVTEEQRRDLDRIRWNQKHLLKLITQILDYVRLDAGHVDVATEEFDLGEVARDAAGMVESLLAEMRQTLALQGCDSDTIAEGDADKCLQIVINLLTNAVKYSPPDSGITLRCGVREQRVFVEVVDRGPGIPAGDLESIFEPFVQLKAGHASRAGGIGLGLAVARRLAQVMHGSLTASSRQGEGATFRLVLPPGSRARREAEQAT
jgi:signal transduction histidine kinase